jgi:hypothetical protein
LWGSWRLGKLIRNSEPKVSVGGHSCRQCLPVV